MRKEGRSFEPTVPCDTRAERRYLREKIVFVSLKSKEDFQSLAGLGKSVSGFQEESPRILVAADGSVQGGFCGQAIVRR